MEKADSVRVGVLLDLYGGLLTQKQLDMMSLYYNDDLSLSEIAAQHGISRQGVHDTIKRSVETLEHYDSVLGLTEAEKKRHRELAQLKEQALDAFEECKKVSFGKNIADKIIVLLESLDAKLDEYENNNY